MMKYTKMRYTFPKAFKNNIYMLSAYFGKLDLVLFSLLFIYSVFYWQEKNIFGNSIIFLAILSTIVGYICGKTLVWLIAIFPVPMHLHKKHFTVIFVPEKEKVTIERACKSCCSKEKDKTLVCQYDWIRKIVVFPGGRGYFIYRQKNINIATLLLFFYPFNNDFFDIPIDEWIDIVKEYNPKVKVKQYKHRFWMF